MKKMFSPFFHLFKNATHNHNDDDNNNNNDHSNQ